MTEGRGLGERLAERISGPPPAAPVDDAVEWIERRFGASLWSKQREVVESVLSHRYTAVRAAHSVGKSKVAALLMAFWIGSKPTGSAFVFSTAPRTAQVRAILWRELGRAHRIGDLPGRVNVAAQTPEWWIGDELVGVGRKPADLTDPEEAATSLQGIHAEHLLCVLDEAAGLAPWVWDAVDSLASNAGARVVALGNPTIRESRFYEVCQPGSGWHRIKISAFESPNLSGEDVPESVARNLVAREWVEERRRRWGEGSMLYRSRVLAEFPEADAEALISPVWVEVAQQAELEPAGAGTFGCDVARSGSDETAIYEVRGGVARIRHRAQGQATTETEGQLALLLREDCRSSAVVDVIGVGAGVFDGLREQGLPAVAFNSSERAERDDRFENRRAEAYWTLREELKAGRLDLDPDDEDLAAQLLAIRWSVNRRGRIQIEGKDKMRKRGVSSPDRADALAMAVGGRRAGGQPTIVLPSRANGLDESLGRPELGDLGSLDGAIGRVKW